MAVNRHKKKNRKTALGLSSVCALMLAYSVYTNIQGDGFDSNEVYKINNVAMNVKSDGDFTGKLVTTQPALTVQGDTDLVKTMKNNQEIPDVELDVTKQTEEGIVTVKPKVKDKKLGLTYTFSPSEIEVKLIEQKLQEFDVVERDYNLAKNGYLVSEMDAVSKAKLRVTEEDILRIGNVIVEVNAKNITTSGVVQGTVVILDKKGKVIENIDNETEKIDVKVTLSKMGWLKTKEDIASLKDEIKLLKSEQIKAEKRLKTVKDISKRTDLKKEVKFRKSRIKIRTNELHKKQNSLDSLRKTQEAKKLKAEKQSIAEGGLVEKDLKDNG